jgi:hypothetical protein
MKKCPNFEKQVIEGFEFQDEYIIAWTGQGPHKDRSKPLNQEPRYMTSVVEVNKSNDEEIKEYHLKRLYELSLKSIGKKPELEELTDEQKEWVKIHGF